MKKAFNNWSDFKKALSESLVEIVDETAEAGEANLKNKIESNEQIDTGRMHRTVYHRTNTASTYQGEDQVLPEVDQPEKYAAYVGVPAEYAQFPNYGTRYQEANPFFEPGMETTKSDFQRNGSTIEERIKRRM